MPFFQFIISFLSFVSDILPSFRLESPTRSLIMEAPRGVQVSAAAGDFKAACRKELHLQSTEGEVSVQAGLTLRCWSCCFTCLSYASGSKSHKEPLREKLQTWEILIPLNYGIYQAAFTFYWKVFIPRTIWNSPPHSCCFNN